MNTCCRYNFTVVKVRRQTRPVFFVIDDVILDELYSSHLHCVQILTIIIVLKYTNSWILQIFRINSVKNNYNDKNSALISTTFHEIIQ